MFKTLSCKLGTAPVVSLLIIDRFTMLTEWRMHKNGCFIRAIHCSRKQTVISVQGLFLYRVLSGHREAVC